MRKISTLTFGLVFSFVVILSAAADPLKIEEFSSYSLKQQLIAESINLKDVEYNIETMTDAVFIPVGWSSDGKFAYIVDTYPDGFGDLVRDVVVQNMSSDKVMYEKTNRGPEMDEAGIKRGEFPKVFQQALGVYEFSPKKDIEMMEFPLISGDYAYSVHIEQVTVLEEGHFYGDTIESYQVRIKRSDGTSKVVHRYSSAESALYDVQVAGCIKSPYEERIAIVIAEIKHGFEASKSVSPKLIGSHLKLGFE